MAQTSETLIESGYVYATVSQSRSGTIHYLAFKYAPTKEKPRQMRFIELTSKGRFRAITVRDFSPGYVPDLDLDRDLIEYAPAGTVPIEVAEQLRECLGDEFRFSSKVGISDGSRVWDSDGVRVPNAHIRVDVPIDLPEVRANAAHPYEFAFIGQEGVAPDSGATLVWTTNGYDITKIDARVPNKTAPYIEAVEF